MPTTDLYVDTGRGIFVTSRTDSTPLTLSPLVRGTTQNFRVMLLKPTGVFKTPYEAMAVVGQTIQMAIGQLGGSSYLTNQFTWAASSDLANPFFSASLSLNTPNITTALGSAASLACVMQIDRVEAGIPINVILQDAIIKNAIIVDGVAVAPPGRTFLYAETAGSLFLTRRIVGPVEWVNETDPTKSNLLFTDTDGSFQEQPVT